MYRYRYNGSAPPGEHSISSTALGSRCSIVLSRPRDHSREVSSVDNGRNGCSHAPCSGSESKPIRGKGSWKHPECPSKSRNSRYPTLCPAGMFAKSENRHRRARSRDLLQRDAEGLTRRRTPPGRPPAPSRCRSAMWASMSLSISLSHRSSAWRMAKPTLRNASTHGRTTSALPGAILVNTVAFGPDDIGPADGQPAVRASSQRPRASSAAGGLRSAGRRRCRPAPCRDWGVPHQQYPLRRGLHLRIGRGTAAVVAPASSITVMLVSPRSVRTRHCRPRGPSLVLSVIGRRTEIGSPASSGRTRRSHGSASPAWRSARRSRRGRSRRAGRRPAATGRRSAPWSRAAAAAACDAGTSGHGSGKNTRTPVSDPGRSDARARPPRHPRISRMFLTPSRSMPPSSWASPRR